jgi:hypothetical protein
LAESSWERFSCRSIVCSLLLINVLCFTAALDNKLEDDIVSRMEANRSQDDSAKDDELMSKHTHKN